MGLGQRSRHELKYVVDESRAVAIREFVGAYLRPSIYNRAGAVPGEPVISLYFDSPDFLLYRQSDAGLKNRIKLRVRFYDGVYDNPAYLEVKRRVGEVILKSRAMVTRDAVGQLLWDAGPNPRFWPQTSHACNGRQPPNAEHFFFHLCHVLRGRPVLYISYLREAWESPGGGIVRVTFDREIRGAVYDGTGRLAVPTGGVRHKLPDFPPDGVVLEMKFTDGCPAWLSDLVQSFDLHRRSVSKYCACIQAAGLNRATGRFRRPEEESLS